ncbi:hypothetical protein ACFE04_014409 [Oxalis oulophora]
MVRDLTVEDCKSRGVKINKNSSLRETLVAAAKVFSLLLEEENNKKLVMENSKQEILLEEKDLTIVLNPEPLRTCFAVSNIQERFTRGKTLEKSIYGNYEEINRGDNEEVSNEKLLCSAMKAAFKNNTRELKRKNLVSVDSQKEAKRTKPLIKTDQLKEIVNPNIPEALRNYIVNDLKGSEPVLVIQKQLYKSDTEDSQNRFNIPYKQIKDDTVFTKGEKKKLEEKDKLAVCVIAPSLKPCHDLVLRQCYMSENKYYGLIGGWNRFRKRYGFEKDDIVQLWFSRVEGNIHFAFVKLAETEAEAKIESNNNININININIGDERSSDQQQHITINGEEDASGPSSNGKSALTEEINLATNNQWWW